MQRSVEKWNLFWSTDFGGWYKQWVGYRKVGSKETGCWGAWGYHISREE